MIRWFLMIKPWHCLPWRHKWDVAHVSVPMFDPGAKGILKRCTRCPKVVAK